MLQTFKDYTMKKLMLLFVAVAFVGFLSANSVTDDPPTKEKTTKVEQKKEATAKKSDAECQKQKACCKKEGKTTAYTEKDKKK